MNPFAQILAGWACRRQEPAALATIVRTTGSTYRKAGTRMLVHADGSAEGMISAGCLEREVIERAQRTLRDGTPRLVTYDTRRLMGCHGGLEVFIERMDAQRGGHLFAAVEDGIRRRRKLVSTTIFESSGTCHDMLGSHALLGGGEAPACRHLPRQMRDDGIAALRREQVLERRYDSSDGGLVALLHSMAPPVRVLVFGAHPDVVPLAAFCLQLGWEPTVVAHPSQEPPELPAGCRSLFLAPDEITEVFKPDARTAAVIMTHHYGRDLACLVEVLKLGLPYVGLMGPAKRRNQLLGEMAGSGITPDVAALQRLHGPAGLDIGADGPVEIALSIVAEIKGVMNGRAGGPLAVATHPVQPQPEGWVAAA